MKKQVTMIVGLFILSGIVEASPPISDFSPSNSTSRGITTAWTVEPWTGDDTPYRNIRLQIYQKAKSGQDMVALVRKYKAQVNKTPFDPLVAFSYACAMTQAVKQNRAFAQTGEYIQAIEAAKRIIPTHTYEFARIHFLLVTSGDTRHMWKDIGVRLLNRNPNDYAVKFALVQTLDPGQYPKEKIEALNYLHQLKLQKPEYSGIYAMLGDMYFKSVLRTKSEGDANAAISAYQKYISLAPTNEPKRQNAIMIIKLIQSGPIHWRKKQSA